MNNFYPMVNRFKSALYLVLILSFISCRNSNRVSEGNENERENEREIAADTTEKDLGEFAIQDRKERNIDMSQFSRTVLDIPYAANDNIRQFLDITYPEIGEPPYRSIVVFHGGGWASGDKESETIASIFQAVTQGYAVIGVNYRLADEVTWPKPLHDAKAAIRFIRANAETYGLASKKLVVWGASSGGHIAEMLAATNNQPEFEDLTMGNENESSAVQGVVAWYGVADMSTLTDAGTPMANTIMGFDVRVEKTRASDASPVDLVNEKFPPILLIHGTKDMVVPFEQSVKMQKEVAKKAGNRTAILTLFENAGHGDAMIKTYENVADNLNFVDEILFNGNNPYRNTSYIRIRLKD